MADEKDLELEKAKAAAAAKAKAAAAAKAKAAAQAKADADATPTAEATEPSGDDAADEKAKAIAAAKAKAAAIAAAKAKAAAIAKAKAEGGDASADGDDKDDAKAKAIAAAKAKAAAIAAAKAKAQGGDVSADGDDDDAKAKAIAAARAKAAAIAAAKAKAAGGAGGTGVRRPGAQAEEEVPEEDRPSKNRPTLDLIVKKITDSAGADALESSYINFLSKEVPTIVVKKEKWTEVAQLLNEDQELQFDFLTNLHGIDHETHMEVYYNFQSFTHGYLLAVKVKTDRDNGHIPSVTPIWPGANWQEREVFDLFGVTFDGHRDLTRILLPDNWVGHPLRKDYEQYDEEV